MQDRTSRRKLLKTYSVKMSYLGLDGSYIVASAEASLEVDETEPTVACKLIRYIE